jgi:hypothetical protein
MTYSRTDWKDRIVANPNAYLKQNETAGDVELIPNPGVVTEAGTPLNAANMNNIEDGILERATWESVHSLEREVVNLKVLSTLKDKVDGASDFFFDTIASKTTTPDGSSMYLDAAQSNLLLAMSSGANSCTVTNPNHGFVAGTEVTIQSVVSGTLFERKVIQSISGSVLTFTTAVSSAFPIGSVVYRSWADRQTAGSMKFRKAASINTTPFDLNVSTLTYQTMTADQGSYVFSDFTSYQNGAGSYYNTQLGPGGDIMTNRAQGGTTVNVFKRYGDSYVTSQSISVPNIMEYYMSSDGVWLFFVVTATTAGQIPVIIYKLVNGTFVRIPDTSITGITIGTNWSSSSSTSIDDIKISPSTNYFAVAYHSSGQIFMLKRTGDTFAFSPTIATPVSSISGFNFSYDDKFCAWTSIWNPNSAGIFKNNGSGTWTSLIYPLTSLSNYSTAWPVFSPDGKYLCINNATSASYRTVRIYSISGDTFTHYKTDGSQIYGVPAFFSLDSKYIYVSSNVTNANYYWKMTVTDLAAPTQTLFSPAPTSVVNHIKMDPTFTVAYCTSIGFMCLSKNSVDITTADVRYEAKVTKPVKGAVAFVERNNAVAVTISAALSIDSGTESPVAMTAEPDETVDSTTLSTTFSKALPAGSSATLRLTMNRANTTLDPVITKVMGATE